MQPAKDKIAISYQVQIILMFLFLPNFYVLSLKVSKLQDNKEMFGSIFGLVGVFK